MSLEQFKVGLSELYQGEVIGEVALNCLLVKFRSPRQQYLLGSVLQLETETKARLRPTAAILGIDLVESEESRKMGLEMAGSVEDLNWKDTSSLLSKALVSYVDRYREIAETAPTEYKELAESMVVHEKSIQHLWEREALGADDLSINEVVKQLIFPLPKPVFD
jgi:hypothetical protein